MSIKQIKIICIDQPLRFRTKTLLSAMCSLINKLICAQFIVLIKFSLYCAAAGLPYLREA